MKKNVEFNEESFIVEFEFENELIYSEQLREELYKSCDCFLLLYSTTSLTSFRNLQSYINKLCDLKEIDNDELPLVILGNKSDLEDERQVTTEQGENFSTSLGVPFFECSSKIRINIEESIHALIGEWLRIEYGITSEENTENWFKKRIRTPKMKLPKEIPKPQYNIIESTFINNLENLFMNEKNADLKIIFKNNEEINVHQFMLAARSKIFEKIFEFINKHKFFNQNNDQFFLKKEEAKLKKENENEIKEKEKEKEEKEKENNMNKLVKFCNKFKITILNNNTTNNLILNKEKYEPNSNNEDNNIKLQLYIDFQKELFYPLIKYWYCCKIEFEKFIENDKLYQPFINLLDIFKVQNLKELLELKKRISQQEKNKNIILNNNAKEKNSNLIHFEKDILNNNIQKMFETNKFTDFIIKIPNKERKYVESFYVHQALLIERSPYFSHLISSKLLENNIKSLNFDFLNYDSFLIALIYIYSDKLIVTDLNIAKKENNKKLILQCNQILLDLLVISDYLQIPRLKSLCGMKIIEQLDLQLIPDCLIYAEKMDLDELIEYCCWQLGRNFFKFKKSKKYKQLSNDMKNKIKDYQWPPEDYLKHNKSLKVKLAKKMNVYGEK
ncbi:ras-like protein [Anaeramoeba flamelloides]|uniref:Ras-like protein n=1 Tax=Anaeramoeba flamelloides TaxID=1746091 RepID=A0ABQ8YKL9_9EUKA|nr:ras-like protein [Anaeramoeba flamelloides]